MRELRHWLGGLLPETRYRDDVITVAVELATNAVKFTKSGRGGRFGVEITWCGSVVRVAVADGGAPTGPYVIDDPLSEHGRGLFMVRAVSARVGVAGDERGRLVWAEVPWTGDSAMEAGSFPVGHEAAIHQDQAALAQRFTDVPVWFGRCTLQWWALPGRAAAGRLLSAPSARELADLLDRVLRSSRAQFRTAAGEPGAARACKRVSVPDAPVPPRTHRALSRLGVEPC